MLPSKQPSRTTTLFLVHARGLPTMKKSAQTNGPGRVSTSLTLPPTTTSLRGTPTATPTTSLTRRLGTRQSRLNKENRISLTAVVTMSPFTFSKRATPPTVSQSAFSRTTLTRAKRPDPALPIHKINQPILQQVQPILRRTQHQQYLHHNPGNSTCNKLFTCYLFLLTYISRDITYMNHNFKRCIVQVVCVQFFYVFNDMVHVQNLLRIQ